MSPSPAFRPYFAASLLLASLAGAAEFPAPEQLAPNPNLPDPLTMLDGSKIANRAEWESKRKPELKALFQHYMYGRMPPKPKKTIRVGSSWGDDTGNPQFLGGKAEIQELELAFDVEPFLDPSKHRMRVLLILPREAKQPVPVFIGMNFCGNHTVVDHPKIMLPKGWVRNSCAGAENERATDQGRGSQQDVWNADLIIERGYGLATFYSGDIDPDTPDFSDGIAPAFFKSGTTNPVGDDPATIACWAWGFSRVVDWLTEYKVRGVDTSKLIAVGHSRNGKTALLAGAMDDRFALVIPHQAGCGGTGPSRSHNPKAETVARINTSFPHWFCQNFKAFNAQVERLPFDQHCLVALCAPRPVLLSNAIEDQWANPDGQFEMLQAAVPVYRLYDVEGLAPGAKPETGKLIDGRLGYYLREGKHSMSRADWEAFLDFADRHLTAGQE